SLSTLPAWCYSCAPTRRASSPAPSCRSTAATRRCDRSEGEGAMDGRSDAPAPPANRKSVAEDAAAARVPYRHPQPREAFPELIVPNAIPADERLWVPQQDNVW